nr:hypothetical protein [uncultured Rhodopila sp.]
MDRLALKMIAAAVAMAALAGCASDAAAPESVNAYVHGRVVTGLSYTR